MYKRGETRKRGQNLALFCKFYIKKTPIIFRTRLYVFRISDKMRNRSKYDSSYATFTPTLPSIFVVLVHHRCHEITT